jgi:hypothetical protein
VENIKVMEVYKECCNQCLLSKNRIVSAKRVKEIIQGCVRDQSYFICHKATIDGKEICCKSYFDKFGHFSQMVRISERLNMLKYIEQPFPCNKEQN